MTLDEDDDPARPEIADVVELHADGGTVLQLAARVPGRTQVTGLMPGHGGHFHPTGTLMLQECQLCRDRIAWYRRQLDAWESAGERGSP